MNRNACFFKLLQAAVSDASAVTLSKEEWGKCYEQATRHGLQSFLFPVAQMFLKDEDGNRIYPLFSQWLADIVQTDERNKILNERAKFLTRYFRERNYKTCVLKGQGVARLYPMPELRLCGDIDIWVDGKQDAIISCLKDNYIGLRHIDYVHSEVAFFDDAEVEVHFRPSWMYNPITNNRLQKFFKDNASLQFANYDDTIGFAYPKIGFNLVYSLIHINRHIFEEGIGLRQLLDYFYILDKSTKAERNNAFSVLCELGLKKFAGDIMYVEEKVFNLDKEKMLCAPDEKEGTFLLEEILRGGNFGRYDSRNEWYMKESRLKRGLFHLKRNLRYLKHYPSEVLWIPFWSVWHFIWRKRKGYL